MSIRYVQVRGKLDCVSGVRVGGSRDELEIGGQDNPVVRDPVTKEPYLPGSSIKGRMRSLLERDRGLTLKRNGEEPHGCVEPGCVFCKVFGPHNEPRHQHGPSRLIVRDAYLSEPSRRDFDGDNKSVFEDRTENMVNRASNTAQYPRPVERVARGTQFELALTLRLLDEDKDREADIVKLVRDGLKLLTEDGVGGGISRGHGQIRITLTEPQEWAGEV